MMSSATGKNTFSIAPAAGSHPTGRPNRRVYSRPNGWRYASPTSRRSLPDPVPGDPPAGTGSAGVAAALLNTTGPSGPAVTPASPASAGTAVIRVGVGTREPEGGP